jgi:pimeloyl-ACP methyl ester carboxylesterase
MIALLALAAATCGFFLLQAVRAYRAEARSFSPRRGEVPLPEPALPGLSPVAFPSEDGTLLKGWLVPSQNGAAVLFIHGSEADRRALVPEARLLVSQGYGALLFDLPGHGESAGVVRWSEESRAAVRAAARYLAAAPGVRPGKVAAFGFSMGAYTLAQVSDEPLPLVALVLAGPSTDGEEVTREQFAAWGPLTQQPALWADRRAGFVPAPTPLSVVARSQLPILVIWGVNDRVVPPRMADLLARSGPGPREALCLRASGHGDYLTTDGADYSRGVQAFLSRWIAP